MPDITISLDENLLMYGHRYAEKHHMSLNSLIQKLLSETVTPRSNDWLDECFKLMDRANANSGGKQWCRGDLYDV